MIGPGQRHKLRRTGADLQRQLLDRDITLIDLRVDGLVAVRPTKTPEELAKAEVERQKAIIERAKSGKPYPMPPRNLPSETLAQPMPPQ